MNEFDNVVENICDKKKVREETNAIWCQAKKQIWAMPSRLQIFHSDEGGDRNDADI